jgi:Leucine-rich repeat (LRR) protein
LLGTFIMRRLAVLRRLALCALVFGWLGGVSAFAADVAFPDANLDTVIREILKKKQIDKVDKSKPITEEDLATIYFLEAPKREIENLSGLEKCRNLALVKLTGNKIKDVTPLAECVNVQSLDLAKNEIADIGPLAKLVKLQYLQLEDNKVAKIDAVAELKALNALYLTRNQVESLAPVAGLPKLVALYVDKNKVSDLSPLKSVKWLERIGLSDNQVKDLSPLADLTELRYTFLSRNQIAEIAPLLEMAKKDLAGEKRFAPYWNIYIGGNPLSDAAKAQLEELTKLVRTVDAKPDSY